MTVDPNFGCLSVNLHFGRFASRPAVERSTTVRNLPCVCCFFFFLFYVHSFNAVLCFLIAATQGCPTKINPALMNLMGLLGFDLFTYLFIFSDWVLGPASSSSVASGLFITPSHALCVQSVTASLLHMLS